MSSFEQLADDLVGIHSSDPATVYLAAWTRIEGLTRDAVNRSLYEDRSTLRLLGMRRTMFVVSNPLAAVMDAACTRALAGPQHRRVEKLLADNGVDEPARWLELVFAEVLEALRLTGPMTGRELSDAVPELRRKLKAGPGSVGATTRVLFLMATDGLIVRGRPRGSWLSSQYEWAMFDDWARGGLGGLDPIEARIDLATRYVAAYGPVTEEDVAWWSGWNRTDTREALARGPIVEVELESGMGLALADDLEHLADGPSWVALLPSLDPSTMGYKNRGFILGSHEPQLFDKTGNSGPIVLVNGHAVGGWGHNSRGDIEVEYLEGVEPGDLVRITAEADRLAAWLDGTIVKPRFANSLWRQIAER